MVRYIWFWKTLPKGMSTLLSDGGIATYVDVRKLAFDLAWSV